MDSYWETDRSLLYQCILQLQYLCRCRRVPAGPFGWAMDVFQFVHSDGQLPQSLSILTTVFFQCLLNLGESCRVTVMDDVDPSSAFDPLDSFSLTFT